MLLKTVGIFLIFGVCAALGFQQADRLKSRVALLRETIAFWEQFRIQLGGLRASPGEIIRMLRQRGAFERNSLARELDTGFRSSPSFRRNLAAALVKCPELRECGADGILLSLGDVIGSQELESQLVALDSVLALLKRRLAEEDAAYGKYGGLYRRLGVLGGLALAVVFL